MEKLKSMARQPEFHVCLFILGLLLFSYPLSLMSAMAEPGRVLLSLFMPWAGIILILLLISRSYEKIRSGESEDRQEGGGNNV